MIPNKTTFKKERHKLKTFKQKYKNGEMSLKDIVNQYKGWRGTIIPSNKTGIKYKSFKTVKRMDLLFQQLFK